MVSRKIQMGNWVWIGWLPNLIGSEDVRCLFCNNICFPGVIFSRTAKILFRFFGPRQFCNVWWKILESRLRISNEPVSCGTKEGLKCPQRMECACSVRSPSISQTQQKPAQYNECSERKAKHMPVSPGIHYPLSRAGGRGVVARTLIKASDSEKRQREVLILRSKHHQRCFVKLLLLLSRHALVPGPGNSHTKFGPGKPILYVIDLQGPGMVNP